MPMLGVALSVIWTQFFPPKGKAPITEANIASQAGKVFIVTGGSSGLGYELSRILYGAGGTVYLLTRTEKNANDAIARIKASYNDSQSKLTGSLYFIHMDLEDLESVQAAATAFRNTESRLDVLFCNAGVASVRRDKLTKQGLEHHLGVNSVGHVLLERLLLPLLASTAKDIPPNSARVVWSASVLVEILAPKGGVRADELDNLPQNIDENYSASKAANWYAAYEFAQRYGRKTGVLT